MTRATGLLERVVIGLLVVLVAVGGFMVLRSGHDDAGGRPDDPAGATTRARAASGGSSYVDEQALPAAARATVRTIVAGGPFPNSNDGVVYPNDAHRLPAQPSGFYHRYGVAGSAAVVQGQDGTLYYTADGSRFRQVRR